MKKFRIGVLREVKEGERRAPLTPNDVRWLINHGIKVEVESSTTRIFKDKEYVNAGAKLVERVEKAKLILGIKEPDISHLHRDSIYMIFSHTVKGQAYNMPLLKAFINKNITLIDYERITDLNDKRLVYFGDFAGICGMCDSLSYYGRKLELKDIENPFSAIKPSYEYKSLDDMKEAVSELGHTIKRIGFKHGLTPFIIGITGHGHVSSGVREILDLLNPIEIHPKNIKDFVVTHRNMSKSVYTIVFQKEEKLRSKRINKFDYEEYVAHPSRYESNLDRYIPYINILMHGAYWDKHYPKMVTKRMVNKIYRRKPLRLGFIADISCDIEGGIELTYKTTTASSPVFTYLPSMDRYIDSIAGEGVTILAVDNLPAELPRDSSRAFSRLIKEYTHSIARTAVKDMSCYELLPLEVRKAVVIENGSLTPAFNYLDKYIHDKG
ncbi:MAG: hypothetical protein ABIB11_04395 [Candidatus Omnitrophota bacterium]